MDELVAWLRKQIADVRDSANDSKGMLSGWTDAFGAVGYTAALSQCEAHQEILDRVVPLVGVLEDKADSEWGSGDSYEGADEILVKAVALAYQHRDGYRDEWRP